MNNEESLVSKIIWGMVDELEVDNDVLTNGYIELKVKEIEQEIDRAREEGKNWTNYQRGWDNALRAVGKFTKEHTSKLTK